jgi:hypothetical protein
VALSSQEGSITMTDRASSSRSPQGDRLPNHSHQDSHGQRTRPRNVIEWSLGRHNRQADQQASTSSGLGNETRDKWQKQFQVLLDDYRFYLNDILKKSKEIQDIIIEERKQKFGQANKSERKEYIKDLKSLVRDLQPDIFQNNEQLAIDEELGYFLKSEYEELKDVRKEAIKFLAKKIEKKIENGIEKKITNKSDKRAEIIKWMHALDEYCLFNHNQRVRDTVYTSVANDMKLIHEYNLEKVKDAKKEDLYKNHNKEIYRAIEKINQSLYSAQDREALRQHERIEAEREWQNLANQGQALDDERSYPSSDSDHEERRNTLIISDDERSYPSSDLDHEERRNTLIISDDEEIRNISHEQLQLDQAIQLSHEQLQLDQAIQLSHEQLQLDQAIQLSREQFNPRVNPHRNLEGAATLIHAQFRQIFERICQIVWPYLPEQGHRLQSQEQQGLEQRYEVIDVSHMASPQIINLGEVLRQQLPSLWRQMLRSDPRHVD